MTRDGSPLAPLLRFDGAKRLREVGNIAQTVSEANVSEVSIHRPMRETTQPTWMSSLLSTTSLYSGSSSKAPTLGTGSRCRHASISAFHGHHRTHATGEEWTQLGDSSECIASLSEYVAGGTGYGGRTRHQQRLIGHGIHRNPEYDNVGFLLVPFLFLGIHI